MKASIAAILFGLTVTSGAQSQYTEFFRPQFHFTPAKNWMNDPNGMVYYDGEYHLFYQHNPFGDKWGHMSWGHAVSKDLVHWEHLPVAIPEADNVMIFSGSAVVDWNNTSGFGMDGKPPLVAIYTGHHTNKKRQDQRIAYSNNRGRTWTNYSGNPVIDLRMADFRDPKVIWHKETKQWVMTVAIPIERKVAFYGSPDLKHWRPLSEFGPAGSVTGIWECPDLFPLDGKWVLVQNVGSGAPAGGSGCQYFVGQFDGARFKLDEKTHPQAVAGSIAAPKGKLLADFEKGYGDWIITGDAFGDVPARGMLKGQMKVDGYLGKGLVNSFVGGDESMGTLTSPAFEITHDYLNFLIGGGAHEGRTCMHLLIDGKIERTQTGSESERLSWKWWNVRDLKGKRATLQIVDNETRGWGHVNVDHIVLSDDAAQAKEPTVLWADYGGDFYAAVSWSDIPQDDGRRIWIGWMSNWQYAQDVPTSPWRSAMTVPRTLGLIETPKGFRLLQKPVDELRKLRADDQLFGAGKADVVNEWLAQNAGPLLDAEFVFTGDAQITVTGEKGEETIVRAKGDTLILNRTRSGRVGFHPKFKAVHKAPLRRSDSGATHLRLLIDTSSIEVFANRGETVITDLILPTAGKQTLSINTDVRSARVSKLKSAW